MRQAPGRFLARNPKRPSAATIGGVPRLVRAVSAHRAPAGAGERLFHIRSREELEMDRRMERTLVTAIAVTALLVPTLALAESGVTVELSASRLVTTSAGHESRVPADHAKPGELLEYRATYHNAGASGVSRLEATLPIPAGTEYQANSADPAPAMASLDGHSFAPLPLTRRVRRADGSEVTREIPASEYRAL